MRTLEQASDALHESSERLYIAHQALALACGPGREVRDPDGLEHYEPKPNARYEGAAVAAAELVTAQKQATDAAKQLRALGATVERAATLTALHLGLRQKLPGAEDTKGEPENPSIER